MPFALSRCLPCLLLLVAIGARAAPPPGHPGTEQAGRTLGLPASAAALPYSGSVLEAWDSNNYTYLLVERGDVREWLVAPRLELAAGARIAYGEGRTFNNWYSKKLARSFAAVTFVPPVQLLPRTP